MSLNLTYCTHIFTWHLKKSFNHSMKNEFWYQSWINILFFHHTGAMLLHTSVTQSSWWREVAILNAVYKTVPHVILWSKLRWHRAIWKPKASLVEICSLWFVFAFVRWIWKEVVSRKSRLKKCNQWFIVNIKMKMREFEFALLWFRQWQAIA